LADVQRRATLHKGHADDVMEKYHQMIREQGAKAAAEHQDELTNEVAHHDHELRKRTNSISKAIDHAHHYYYYLTRALAKQEQLYEDFDEATVDLSKNITKELLAATGKVEESLDSVKECTAKHLDHVLDVISAFNKVQSEKEKKMDKEIGDIEFHFEEHLDRIGKEVNEAKERAAKLAGRVENTNETMDMINAADVLPPKTNSPHLSDHSKDSGDKAKFENKKPAAEDFDNGQYHHQESRWLWHGNYENLWR